MALHFEVFSNSVSGNTHFFLLLMNEVMIIYDLKIVQIEQSKNLDEFSNPNTSTIFTSQRNKSYPE